MNTDKYGIVVLNMADIESAIMQGRIDSLEHTFVNLPADELTRFNQALAEVGGVSLKPYTPLELSIDEFDKLMQSDWLMPDEYKELDIEAWVHEQSPPWDPDFTRISEELEAFKQRNMLDLLRWLKYFVDTCRKENVLWGLGRGSSVASYVLYLIGVHKIDSIKYNLDWQEFLR